MKNVEFLRDTEMRLIPENLSLLSGGIMNTLCQCFLTVFAANNDRGDFRMLLLTKVATNADSYC
jgi:hypothetical protein